MNLGHPHSLLVAAGLEVRLRGVLRRRHHHRRRHSRVLAAVSCRRASSDSSATYMRACRRECGSGTASITIAPSTPVIGWAAVASTALADVRMLRTELIVGYLIAGFAAALIPPGWLAAALHAVGSVPVIGYVLLLIVGLADRGRDVRLFDGKRPGRALSGERGDTARREHDLHLRRSADSAADRDLPQIVSRRVSLGRSSALFALGAMLAGRDYGTGHRQHAAAACRWVRWRSTTASR